LIFDEVVTGFRFAYGGAQEYYGVTPDLCSLGKIVGGGFALAAIAGRADIMRHFDRLAVEDEDFIFQVGTLSGNPVAAVAGLATLEVLKRPGTYEQVFATGRELMGALSDLLKEAGIAAQVIGEPPLFDVVFTDQPIKDYRDTLNGHALQPAFARPRHHEGREQVLCEPRPHPGRHRSHDRRLDGRGEGTQSLMSSGPRAHETRISCA
jgi:glutamate-1-semialdehyde 2,1-aminomutase